MEALGKVGTTVVDGPHKLFVGGLPYQMTDAQLIELLSVFGPLKGMHLVRDAGSSTSKGYAFFEYTDPAHGDYAMVGLHGLELAGKPLTVRRANPLGTGAIPAATAPLGNIAAAPVSVPALAAFLSYATNVGAPAPTTLMPPPPLAPQEASGMGAEPVAPRVAPGPIVAGVAPAETGPSRAIRLRNMVAPSDLENDSEYEDICVDVGEELGRHGRLVRMSIPRAGPEAGSIFALFETPQDAAAATSALEGRLFAGNHIVVECEPEAVFDGLQ